MLLPDTAFSEKLSSQYALRATNSIRHVSSKVCNPLGISDVEIEIENTLKLLAGKKLSSPFYIINTRLTRALLETRDVQALKNTLVAISKNPVENYSFQDILIDLPGSNWSSC